MQLTIRHCIVEKKKNTPELYQPVHFKDVSTSECAVPHLQTPNVNKDTNPMQMH